MTVQLLLFYHIINVLTLYDMFSTLYELQKSSLILKQPKLAISVSEGNLSHFLRIF